MKSSTSVPRLCREILPVTLGVASLHLAGCYTGAEFVDRIYERGGVGSTIKYNTPVYEGFDELDTRGQIWAGTRLSNVTLSCAHLAVVPEVCANGAAFALDSVWSDAGELWGEKDGVRYHGDDFVEAQWSIVPGGGSFAKHLRLLKIRDHDEVSGVHHYIFEVFDDRELTWSLGCYGEASGAAYVLGDISVDTQTGNISSRPGTVYIACAAGAVGKAVSWGYTPWELGVENFTAAVRVVRADYCADGRSWTDRGAEVQMRDVWGINDFVDPLAYTEAVWDEDGIVCVSDTRVPVQGGANNVPAKPGYPGGCIGTQCGGLPNVPGIDTVTCDGVPIPRCNDKDLLGFGVDDPPYQKARWGTIWTKHP